MDDLDERLRRASILVVDDNPTNVALLSALLEDEGYENVAGETDPRRVEGIVSDRMPDLVLLDIRMPHMTGHDVLAMLKGRFGDNAMPVIVLTAQTDKETRMRALEGGARDFLTKPFDQLEVLHRIRNTLEAHELFKDRRDRASLLEDMVAERTHELQHMASHDPVTGLVNRRVLLDEIEKREVDGLAVLYLAIDRTSRVAEILGHATLERLLAAIGERLSAALPAGCLVGSWGGADFLVIDPRDGGAQADALAAALIAELQLPFAVDGNSIAVQVRIGVNRSDGGDAARMVRLAGMALPPLGEGEPWRIFSPDIEERVRARHEMEKHLQGALANDELHLVFQPKIDLGSGRVIGAEALMRWNSAALGPVSPAAFIPVAEETGMVVEFGDWALEKAARLTSEWRESGVAADDFIMAVNVAARQLEAGGLAPRIGEILTETGLPGRALEIEVTESGLMRDVEGAVARLGEVSAMGCGVAIDDFGTGYSSLSYLKRLPVTTLKIDQSFVRDLHVDENDRAIARTVIAMAKSLGLNVVAEGIEMKEHEDLLKDYGCGIGQGYFYAKPLAAPDFVTFCTERGRALV